jgi:membrane protein YqaA with SNARE-associated domain
MDAWMHDFLALISLPEVGLPAVFVVAALSATLIPGGSEWAVLAVLALDRSLFWPTMLVATAGNTLGGAISWWMGWGAHRAVDAMRHSSTHVRALDWLQRLGPKACLFSWLPVVGDPLTAVAGWLKLPFWPCMLYSAIGKFLRYVIMTSALLWLWPAS